MQHDLAYLHEEFGKEVNAHFLTSGSSILTRQVTDIPTSNKYKYIANNKYIANIISNNQNTSYAQTMSMILDAD